MTANDERELAEQIRDLFQTKPFTYSLDLASAKKIAGFILHRERRVVERIIGLLEKTDPLLAIADWEDSDDIAHAVRKYLVEAIRAGGEVPNGSTHCPCGKPLGADRVKFKASLYHPACKPEDESGTRS